MDHDPLQTDGHDGDARWPATGVRVRTEEKRARESAPLRALGSIGFVLDATRRRRSGRMALWSVVLVLALTGVGLLAYPFATDVWAGRIQDGLVEQFEDLELDKGETVPEGKALTRLQIPKLGVDTIVVEGTSAAALRAGAGHYPGTALPGDTTGNVAIAGHRTGYGRPFRNIDKLKSGDRINLTTPFGTYIYQVVPPFDGHGNPWVVSPLDWSVITPTARPSLTLTSCHPPHSAASRIVVRAVLVRSPSA